MKTINVNSSIEELIWVPTAVQFTFGAFGNVLALVLLILSRRQHKWISFYRLYAGLVITDLSIWLLAEPVALARYASKFKWTIPPGVCQYESYMTMFGLLSSAFIICAMSVDRLKAMYSTHDEHHGKLYMGILVVIWTFSGLYSGIHIWTDQTRDFYPGTWCYFNYINSTDNTIGKMNTYSYLVLGCTSILLIVILNILMLTLACCNTELRSRLTDRHRISGGYDWHSYVFLIIVAVVFTTLWTAHLVSYNYVCTLVASQTTKEFCFIRWLRNFL